MKVLVKMYVAGQVLEDVVVVEKFADVEKVIKNRHPQCKIIGKNPVF